MQLKKTMLKEASSNSHSCCELNKRFKLPAAFDCYTYEGGAMFQVRKFYLSKMVLKEGLEPSPPKRLVPKTSAYTNSATPAYLRAENYSILSYFE